LIAHSFTRLYVVVQPEQVSRLTTYTKPDTVKMQHS